MAPSIALTAAGLSIVTVAYTSIRAAYFAFFHPLAKIPGPKLYAITDFFYVLHILRGDWVKTLEGLHAKYGPAVRFGPDDVSFITPEAWKTIYGHKAKSVQNFEKDLRLYSNPSTPNVLLADNNEHRRQRRILSHAFSEKALRGQEDVVKKYVDHFIANLARQAKQRDPLDMVMWYNLTTFDIIGDLAFGKSFGLLDNGMYNDYVANIFKAVKNVSYLEMMKRYPSLTVFKRWILRPEFVRGSIELGKFSRETVMKRVTSGNMEREDFMSYILRHNDTEKGLNQDQLVENSRFLIVAGSETTATLLSGATFHLLSNPDKYKKLVAEVRGAFKSESEITMQSVQSMTYLLAVLNESLRMYPPVPVGLARIVPQGGQTIGGYYIPENTSVSVSQWSAYHSAENWYEPEQFLPERWIDTEDPKYANDQRDVLKPFSFGPRDCLGKNLAYVEMRIILARVLFNFDLEMAPSSKEWTDQHVFFLWEKDSLMVKLTPVVRKT